MSKIEYLDVMFTKSEVIQHVYTYYIEGTSVEGITIAVNAALNLDLTVDYVNEIIDCMNQVI